MTYTDATDYGDTRLRDRRRAWPDPTEEQPTLEQIGEWVFDDVCETTDGCTVEPDGTCEHGHPSWLLRLGLI